tara:strand:+ start:1021 stop:1158 length:138 start_codon:yes stop_codon:yes gene_type:complete
MTTEKLLNDLEEIVNRGLEDSAIPHREETALGSITLLFARVLKAT